MARRGLPGQPCRPSGDGHVLVATVYRGISFLDSLYSVHRVGIRRRVTYVFSYAAFPLRKPSVVDGMVGHRNTEIG